MLQFTISNFFTCTATISLALFVFFVNPQSRVNRIFFLYSCSIAWWAFFTALHSFTASKSLSLISAKLMHIAVPLIPILFFHFVIVILKLFNKHKNMLLLGYFMGLIFILLDLASDLILLGVRPKLGYHYFMDAGILYHFLIITFVVYAGAALYLMFKECRIATGNRRNQLRYLFGGSLFGYIFGISCFLPAYNITIFPYPFGSYAISIYVLITTYAIVKHGLLDIKVAITRAGIFAFVYAFILGIPFLIIKLAKPYLVGAFSDRWWLVILAVGMILAGVGPLIYMKLQKRAEAMLLREERKRHQALARASRDILRFNRLDSLLRAIVHNLVRIMQIKLAAIYLIDEERKIFGLKSYWQPPIKNPDLPKELAFDSLLVKELNKQKNRPLSFDEISFYSRKRDAQEVYNLMKNFESLKAQLIIPAVRSDKLIGFLALGDKRSERSYSIEDIEVLMVLSNHATLAIENAIFNEQERERQAILFHSASLASLGTMASMMGHQVNNRFQAVNNLAGFSEVLETMLQSKDNLSSEEWKKLIRKTISALRRISDEATKGGETVASIRRLGRLSSEEFKPVEFKEILDVALGVLRYKIKFDEFEFSLHVPDTLPKIMGDATQLGEVFFNLIDNAYDAIKERKEIIQSSDYKPQISINAYIKRDGRHLYIDVSDTGNGIKEDFISKLFVPFYTTKASSGKGTGLGLHVIKRVIEFHKGRISVQSKYGEGTTFKIELPVALSENKEK